MNAATDQAAGRSGVGAVDIAPAEIGPVDVCVVGAGPAGLAAAVHAAEAGARVVLVDAGESIGGQYWRHRGPGLEPADIYHDTSIFVALADRAARLQRSGRFEHVAKHHVWTVSAGETGCVARALDQRIPGHPAEVVIRSRRLILATGAFDREIPFPGWDLPGVMTIGGLQSLLKGSGVVAGPKVLVAGTGPFIVAAAAGILLRGGTVVGIHEANNPIGWARHAHRVGSALDKVGEAAGYAAVLARHRVRISHRSMVVGADGTDRLESVTTAKLAPDGSIRSGTQRRVPVDVLAVGWGFVPQVELHVGAGCAVRHDADGAVLVTVDDDQITTNRLVLAAGEPTGVGGAALAAVEGAIAGIAAARASGFVDGAGVGRLPSFKRKRSTLRRFAAALQDVYPVPPGWERVLADDTVICRCEEVDYAEVKDALALGARDVRTVKLLSRAGMGWCQGRMCAYAVECLTGRTSPSVPDVRGGSERAIATPVPLGILAAGAPGTRSPT